MSERLTLPVLPLRDFVLFPGVTTPINAGKPEDPARHRGGAGDPGAPGVRGLAAGGRPDRVTPEVALHHRHGRPHRPAPARARRRAAPAARRAPRHRDAHHREGRPPGGDRPRGRGDAAAEHAATRRSSPSSARCASARRSWASKPGLPEEVVQQVLDGVDRARPARRPRRRLHRAARPQRQVLLETLSVEERLRRVLIHVQRQIDVLEAQEDIKSKVQEELGDRQREMYLREQLKAIQKELGEGDAGDDDRRAAREARQARRCPTEARKEVERELGAARRMGRESMESQVIRTYLERIAELPWSTRSRGAPRRPAGRARSSTRTTTASSDVKDRVLEFLAVRQLRAGELERRLEGRQAPTRPPRTRRPPTPTARRPREAGRYRPPPRTRRRHERRQPRGRSCCSSARRASARPRSPSRSPAPWGASTSASRSAACATRPTSAATAAPTSAPCPAGSSRA